METSDNSEVSSTDDVWKLRWEYLFNSSPESIIILSEDQTILDANETTLKLLGRKKEDIMGRKCYEIFHNSNSPPNGCPFLEMKNKNWKPSANEMQTIIGDFIVEVVPMEILGEVRKILHFARDITLIKELKTKLINSLQRYISFLNTLVELDSLLLEEKNLGNMLKKSARIICKNENFDSCWIMLKGDDGLKTVAKCGANWNFEYRYKMGQTKNGAWIEKADDNNFVFLPLNIKDSFLGFIVLLKNGEMEISEEDMNVLKIMADNIAMAIRERRLEIGRMTAYRELEKNIQSFAILVDGIRNPLAVIMGIAEIEIKDEKMKGIIMEQVRKIDENIQKIDERWNKSERLLNLLNKM